MDNTNQPPPQGPTNNLPPQAPSPVVESQQPIVAATLPPTNSKKRIVIILAIVLFLMAAAAWFALSKEESTTKEKGSNSQTSQVTGDSSKCAYIPKQNYPENEGLYGIWRERAKNIRFDVYLPCDMLKDFTVSELGISDENGGQIFLTFNRPDPEEGEDNLQNQTRFYVVQERSLNNECAIGCTKAGDTKFGPVLKNDQGDLYLTVGSSVIEWSYPPYDDSDDVKPMLDILNSLQKVDPQKLEFFNG
jgi:hypothetical protein